MIWNFPVLKLLRTNICMLFNKALLADLEDRMFSCTFLCTSVSEKNFFCVKSFLLVLNHVVNTILKVILLLCHLPENDLYFHNLQDSIYVSLSILCSIHIDKGCFKYVHIGCYYICKFYSDMSCYKNICEYTLKRSVYISAWKSIDCSLQQAKVRGG